MGGEGDMGGEVSVSNVGVNMAAMVTGVPADLS